MLTSLLLVLPRDVGGVRRQILESVPIYDRHAEFVAEALGVSSTGSDLFTSFPANGIDIPDHIVRSWTVDIERTTICGRDLGFYSKDLDRFAQRLKQVIDSFKAQPGASLFACYE